VSLIRVQKTAAATLTRTFFVDETPTDCTGTVTVAVTRQDGTAVVSGNATGIGSGKYTYLLPGGPASPASATWQLDSLVVTWTGTIGSAAVSLIDTVEVVGGFYFGLAEARASDAALSDPVKYTTAALAAARIQVEQEIDEICYRAFVPRFRRVALDGTGTDTISTPDPDLRTLRAASIAYLTGGDLQVLTGSYLTRVVPVADGLLVRQYGLPWPFGTGNAVVEYEYGLDAPPEELRQAGMKRMRSVLTSRNSGVPDRASSYTTQEGSTYRLTLPGRRSTGIPDIDAVYMRYAVLSAGFA
jgi:hypothetical protein